MDASWESFLGVLPPWMREQVDALGAGSLRQLRLRQDRSAMSRSF